MPTGGNVDARLCVRRPIKKVDATLKGSFIGRDIVALRPKNASVPVDDLLRFFHLGDFSFSEPWAWLAQATSAASRSELVRLLREVRVPVVPGEMAEALQENYGCYEELSHAEPDVMGLLECRNRNEFEQRLLRLRAEGHALRQALDASSSLPYLVRNFYPFPIALPYRSLAAFRNHALLVEQLRVAEGLLAFVGSLALALSRPAPSELVKAFDARRDFSAGAWLEIGTKAIATLDSAAHGDLANGLRLLRGGFNKHAAQLIEIRNDYHHHRIDNAKISDKTSELSTLLTDCFEELAFIVRFPLFRVCDVTFDHQSDKKVHSIELYRGADPVHDPRSFESDQIYKRGL